MDGFVGESNINRWVNNFGFCDCVVWKDVKLMYVIS